MEPKGKNVDTFLHPLLFPTDQCDKMDISGILLPSEPVHCLLCDEKFSLETEKNEYFKHLFEQHKLVISNHKSIAYLNSYLELWRDKLSVSNLREFCSVIKTNHGVNDKEDSEEYYLLSEKLPEDQKIRDMLHKKRLNYVLKCQQTERDDSSFSRLCLFCNKAFNVNRSNLLTHMLESHNFSIGRPDNIVFIKDFLNLIDEKLEKLQCLYCDRIFKNRAVLKEHMRKKLHKRLNPNNSDFDKFYIVNYVEAGKNWKDSELEAMVEKDDIKSLGFNSDEENENWDDWDDDTDSNSAFCFFCPFSSGNKSKLLSHMKENHGFDFTHISTDLGLDYYLQIRLVNFIRRQVLQNLCYSCQEKFDNQKLLIEHMTASGHIAKIPENKIWNQPEYLFPTYENDNFLWNLDDKDQSGDTNTVPIVKEDIKSIVQDSILKNKDLLFDLDEVKASEDVVEKFQKTL